MAIVTGSYHGGTGNWLRIQGGLRARVANSRQIDIEFAGDNQFPRGSLLIFVGGVQRTAANHIVDADNPRLLHFIIDGAPLSSSSGDIRIGLLNAHENQPAFTASGTTGLYLAYDGTDLTPAEAEYEEHIVPSNAIDASKPTDTNHLQSLPSGGWSVICETPERLIAATSALRLVGPRTMQWDGCYVLCEGFFRDIHWTWAMSVRSDAPALTGTTASQASDVFLVDEDGFDRSGTRRGGVDYGGRVVRLRKVNGATVTGGANWGFSSAKYIGATCGLGILHAAGARPSWHAVRNVVDIPVSGLGDGMRTFGLASTNPLSHINASYESTDNWSISGFRPMALMCRFDTTSGTAQAHTPGYCRWRFINAYPHFRSASGSPEIDELLHIYGSEEASKSVARMNGSRTTSSPTVLDGYSTEAAAIHLDGAFYLDNPRIDTDQINRDYDRLLTAAVRQDISWRIVGISASATHGKLRAHVGGPASTFASAGDATISRTPTAAALRALTGTLSKVTAWSTQGNTGLGDNRKVFLSFRRADINFDAIATLEPDTSNGARSGTITATPDPAFTGTTVQAAALASRFSLSRTAKTITVSSSATLQDMYNWLKHYYAETDAAAQEAVPCTLSGGTMAFADGWSIEVATGATLSSAASATRLELSSAHPWPYPVPAWSATPTYAVGSIVSHNSRTWRNTATIQGAAPGASPIWVDITRVGRLILTGTAATSGISYTDASGRAITIATEPGARVIMSASTHELRYYVPEATGGRLKCFSRASRTAALSAGTDIVLQGVSATERVQALTRIRERRSFLVGIYDPVANTSRIAIFDDAGRQIGSTPYTPIYPNSTEITSIAYARENVAYLHSQRPGSPASGSAISYGVEYFDPSLIYAGRTPEYREFVSTDGFRVHLAWTGNRLMWVFQDGATTRISVFTVRSGGGYTRRDVYRAPYTNVPFTTSITINGASLHHEIDTPTRAILSIIGGASPVRGVDLEIDPAAPQTVHARRAFSMPGINAAGAFSALDVPTLSPETLATAGDDGRARITTGGTAADVRVTAKKEGYDYRSAVINTGTLDHALAIPRNASIDTSLDISDYDLTPTGGDTGNIYADATESGTGSTIYFSDTYTLKANPEVSKRVLDAVLSTDEGLKLLHRYEQAPSLNNNGRVVSFHPTFVNILPGWIAFIRKASLPLNSRAVFGIATYIGDDETYYRPRELNGGHVEVADPAVYVQFDSARIRAVSQEVIGDADNQAAIGGAVWNADISALETAADGTAGKELYDAQASGGGGTTLDSTQLAGLTALGAQNVRNRLPTIATTGDLPAEAPSAADVATAVMEREPMSTDGGGDSLANRIRDIDSDVENLHTRLTMQRAQNLDNLATRPARVTDLPSRNAQGEVRIDEEDLTTKLNSNAPLQNALGGINWNRGLGLVDDVNGSVGAAVVRIVNNLTNTRIEALDDVGGIKGKTDRLKFPAGTSGEQPVEAELKSGHGNVPISTTGLARSTEVQAVGTAVSNLNDPTATDIATAVAANSSIATMIANAQTAATQATLARQGILNTAVVSASDSTLRVKSDDGASDLAIFDLRDADGRPAGANPAFTRMRRRSPA